MLNFGDGYIDFGDLTGDVLGGGDGSYDDGSGDFSTPPPASWGQMPGSSGSSGFGSSFYNSPSQSSGNYNSQYGNVSNLNGSQGSSGVNPPMNTDFSNQPQYYQPSNQYGGYQSNNNYPVGNPQGASAAASQAAQDAEALRHNQAQEQLARQQMQYDQQMAQQKLQLAQQQLQQAQQTGNPQAIQQAQMGMSQAQQAAAALAQQQLQADQQYREQQLAQNAAQMGLSASQAAAQLQLSRDQFDQTIKQFDAQFGLASLSEQDSVDQFNQQLGYNYWNSGNTLAYQTWATQMNNDTQRYGIDTSADTQRQATEAQYNLGMTNAGVNWGLGNRNADISQARLGLDTQGQNFDQSVQMSNLAANPRNLAQSLIMLGMSPEGARATIANSPYVQQWMSNPSQLDRTPYMSSVPFQYSPNDNPMAFLPSGQGNTKSPAYTPPAAYQYGQGTPSSTPPQMGGSSYGYQGYGSQYPQQSYNGAPSYSGSYGIANGGVNQPGLGGSYGGGQAPSQANPYYGGAPSQGGITESISNMGTPTWGGAPPTYTLPQNGIGPQAGETPESYFSTNPQQYAF